MSLTGDEARKTGLGEKNVWVVISA